MKLNVLSLFDGVSVARLALHNLNIDCNYFASEIDTHAITVSQKNYPDIIRLGDVRDIHTMPVPIDLLIGGSPCQDLSACNNTQAGLTGTKSSLFFEYVRLKNELKPKYFLFENVASMKASDKKIISDCLGVEPIKIDSGNFCAQRRNRLYWTNIKVQSPGNAHHEINLTSILESGYTEVEKAACLTSSYAKVSVENYFIRNKERQLIFNYPFNLTANTHTTYYSISASTQVHNLQLNISKNETYKFNSTNNKEVLDTLRTLTRKLTINEAEQLQTLPTNYTYLPDISTRKRYELVGNSFNCKTIEYILSFM